VRAGRKRTPLSWQSYVPEREDERDAGEGLWPRAKLEAMDRKFVERVERAIRSGASITLRAQFCSTIAQAWLLLCIRNDTAGWLSMGSPFQNIAAFARSRFLEY
jgi:hypothetical protein